MGYRWDHSWISHILEDGAMVCQPNGEWMKRKPLGLKTKHGYVRDIPDLYKRVEDTGISDVATLYTYIVHTWGNSPPTEEELKSLIEWTQSEPHWRRYVMEQIMV